MSDAKATALQTLSCLPGVLELGACVGNVFAWGPWGEDPIGSMLRCVSLAAMNLLLLVVILLLLFGGGGFYLGGPAFGGGGLGLVLLICLIIYFMGGFRGSKG